MRKTNQNKVFLKANWQRLVSANYVIDPLLLKEHLPRGTVLEPFNDKHFVSLVAFRYCDTRLFNFSIPGYKVFEEINLRFYVRRELSPGKWRSEVAFTKLFFPRRALTFVARVIYKENYETARMKHIWQDKGNELITAYGLKKRRWHDFQIRSTKDSQTIIDNSDEHFFSKHYWGTSRINSKASTVYNIEHPEWHSHKVLEHDITFNFENIFGKEFKHLSNQTPDSVHLFDGSEVVVNRKSIV